MTNPKQVSMRNAKLRDKKTVFKKYHKCVVEEDLLFPDGFECDWVYMDTPKSVMIVALTPENEVPMIHIYRHNLKKSAYELPAGGVEENEDELEAAKRELLEESGFASEEWVNLGEYYALPSETNREVSVFLALNAQQIAEPQADDLIEKYWEMERKMIPFADINTLKKIKECGVSGIETAFALLAVKEYLAAQE